MASYQPINRHSYISVISNHQEIPSFPSKFSLGSHHLTMILVMYALPILILMALGLSIKLCQQHQVKREMKRLQAITRLERIWQPKAASRRDRKVVLEEDEDC